MNCDRFQRLITASTRELAEFKAALLHEALQPVALLGRWSRVLNQVHTLGRPLDA